MTIFMRNFEKDAKKGLQYLSYHGIIVMGNEGNGIALVHQRDDVFNIACRLIQFRRQDLDHIHSEILLKDFDAVL